MLAAKPSALCARTVTIEGLASSRARRATERGQSVIVAVIVLFLLLFLGAIFIALIANNARNVVRSAQTSASGRFSEAGINYLDQQLTSAPEGADWRPIPDNIADINDPDYRWVKPYDPTTGEGGYTRVNFGGPDATVGNLGGRALVRISYRPNYPISGTQTYPANVPPAAEVNKYLKLEAVGRSGQINPNDPTTYGNTDAASLRVELVAYKSIGINEFVRQITNLNNKPVDATLGAPFPVYDHDQNQVVSRNIESIYNGPVRVNAGLTFYGVNRFTLNQSRNDALEVAGPITLNKVANSATALTATDPTQVYVNPAAGTTTPNVFPSLSGAFTTLGGLVRDNPRGAETASLSDASGNKNLRSVGRNSPPIIDASIGPNGLTRYRALTRNSAPLDAAHYMQANPFTGAPATNPDFASAIGWGAGLYLNNANDVQQTSERLTSAYSLRSDWLNNDPTSSANSYWKGDAQYVPPAVTITLTPRYMILQRSATAAAQGTRGFRFRSPAGVPLGDTIVRYTNQSGTTTANPPTVNLTQTANNQITSFEGYPADPIVNGVETPGGTDQPAYGGDFVIYAEGNVRIRGVVGGLDTESGKYFRRRLTVVSGGTIYVDGNLLRDNIAPDDASTGATQTRKQSSIALLAKNYIAVNTTQFFSPDVANYSAESQDNAPPFSLILPSLDGSVLDYNFHATFGPTDANNTVPVYAKANPPTGVQPATLFLRHGVSFSPNAANVAIQTGVNDIPNAGRTMNFAPAGGFGPILTSPNSLGGAELLLTTPANAQTYVNDAFVIDPAMLFGNGSLPGTLLGSDNLITQRYDPSLSQVAYRLTRFAVAPLDIRIEALMYAQEGSFFIIPGPWFNTDANDTFGNFLSSSTDPAQRKRPLDDVTASQTRRQLNPLYPFYKEPMDIRITFFGAITENLPAEFADQGAWMEKWGWIPDGYGSTGLTGQLDNGTAITPTAHGRNGTYKGPGSLGGNGLVYDFDERAIAPYSQDASGVFVPLRPNPNFAHLGIANLRQWEPLPLTPRLPVAPGLLYYGQNPNRTQ